MFPTLFPLFHYCVRCDEGIAVLIELELLLKQYNYLIILHIRLLGYPRLGTQQHHIVHSNSECQSRLSCGSFLCCLCGMPLVKLLPIKSIFDQLGCCLCRSRTCCFSDFYVDGLCTSTMLFVFSCCHSSCTAFFRLCLFPSTSVIRNLSSCLFVCIFMLFNALDQSPWQPADAHSNLLNLPLPSQNNQAHLVLISHHLQAQCASSTSENSFISQRDMDV